jgi:hypothetical protein
MDRRSLLLAGAGLAATAAGCTGLPGLGDEAAARAPRASLRLDPVDDQEIARRLDRHVPEGDGTRAALLDEVLETGNTARESRRPRLRAGTLVHGGTRYDLSVAVESRRGATVYPILLENLSYDGVTASDDATRVRFGDLPAVDQRVFRENGLAGGEVLGIGTQLIYPDSARERSALVPPTETVIVWGPDRKGLFDSRHGSRDTTLVTRRYTAERLEPAATYGRRLRERYALALSAVSEAEAQLLRTAAETGVYGVPRGRTPRAPFRSLADRFRGATDVREVTEGYTTDVREATEGHATDETPANAAGERSGTYLVRFEGTVYLMRLHLTEPSTG